MLRAEEHWVAGLCSLRRELKSYPVPPSEPDSIWRRQHGVAVRRRRTASAARCPGLHALAGGCSPRTLASSGRFGAYDRKFLQGTQEHSRTPCAAEASSVHSCSLQTPRRQMLQDEGRCLHPDAPHPDLAVGLPGRWSEMSFPHCPCCSILEVPASPARVGLSVGVPSECPALVAGTTTWPPEVPASGARVRPGTHGGQVTRRAGRTRMAQVPRQTVFREQGVPGGQRYHGHLAAAQTEA